MKTKIVLRKIYNEKIWSLSIVALLTVGLTTWLIIPSISVSLQQGLSTYNDNVATYIYIYNTGTAGYNSRIPSSITDNIGNISGVQKFYPIIANFTSILNQTISFRDQNGNISNITVDNNLFSAVIGGRSGFPNTLISLINGKMPANDEAGFIINGLSANIIHQNKTYPVGFQESSQNESRKYLQFNATAVGQMPYNPMLQLVMILWNSVFLRNELGIHLYNQTFGGEGANYFIVKVQNIQQVDLIANKLKSIFSNYQGYSVIYDQTAVDAQLSFQSHTGLLYELIGITSLFSAISIVFLLTYVLSSRRSWEAGLLLTQGWDWNRITKLFLFYYIALGLVALGISIPFSLYISTQFGYSFQVYANTLVIPIVISPSMIISSVIISLLVSSLAAYFAVWRMKKMGLDNLLREY